jgi:hypothetical protein
LGVTKLYEQGIEFQIDGDPNTLIPFCQEFIQKYANKEAPPMYTVRGDPRRIVWVGTRKYRAYVRKE